VIVCFQFEDDKFSYHHRHSFSIYILQTIID